MTAPRPEPPVPPGSVPPQEPGAAPPQEPGAVPPQEPGAVPPWPEAAEEPPVAEPPPSRPGRRAWLKRTDARVEWAIVLLMVFSAVASAVSYYNATRFADRAQSLANEALFVASLENQRASRANTAVVHDQRVALGCIAAESARDAAITTYSQRLDAAVLPRVAAAEQRRIALRGLLLGGIDCETYDAQAAQALLAGASERDDTDWRAMLADVDRTADAEPLAVGAAVLMAIVLLLLTLADLAASARWVAAWLALAVLVSLIGAGFASAAVLAAGDDRRFVVVIVAAIVAVLGLFLFVSWLAGQAWLRIRSTQAPTAGVPAGDGRPARRLGWVPRRGLWWAEVLGAASLVAFAMTVLTLSVASSREHDASTAADRYALEARQALETGEQAALSVFAYVEELAWVEAAGGGSVEQQTSGETTGDGENPATRDILDRWALETGTWEARLADLQAGHGPAVRDAVEEGVAGPAPGWRTCLDATQILPWRQVGALGSEAVPLPVALAVAQREDPFALHAIVERSTIGATRCSTQAAMARLEASAWGDATANFTVALLILGLAGFLFTLASDRDRAPWPRRWLLGSALVGLTAGLALTLVTTLGGPRAADPERIEDGAAAFAGAKAALATSDCPEARELARAASVLEGLAGADELMATTMACSEHADWLIAPWMPAEDVRVTREALEAATASRDPSASVAMSLGWTHLLDALARPAEDERSALLGRSDAFTRDALRDPRLAPWSCFNLALSALAGGDPDTARARYVDAIAVAGGMAPADPWCPVNPSLVPAPDAGRTPSGDSALLAALADLELLGDDAAAQPVRELLLADPDAAGREGAAAGDASAPVPSVEGLEVVTGPHSIGLAATADAPLSGVEVVVAWYHRPHDRVPWAVISGVSGATLRPMVAAGISWQLGRPLPPGEYRADVYADGRLAGRLESGDDWWTANGLDAADWRMVRLADLGLSVLVPRAWEEQASVPGVEIRFGAGDGEVAFRRSEGADGTDLAGQLAGWSGSTWADEDVDTESPYLGLVRRLQVRSAEDTRLAIGYRQYLGQAADVRLQVSVDNDSCPGTMVMTSLRADEPGVLETVWGSMEFAEQPPVIPADSVPVDSPFSSAAFSIGFPADWSAVACPRSFVATAPGGTAYVMVQSFPFDGALDVYADAARSTLPGLEGYELRSERPVTLSNGVPAIRFEFASGIGESTFDNVMTIAVAEGLAHTMTITDIPGIEPGSAAMSAILDTFRPTVPAVVGIVCADCDADARAARRDALDAITGRLAIVDSSCRDETEYAGFAGDGARAHVTCSLPSGIRVDFAAWPDRASFDRSTSSFTAVAGAVIRDWWLRTDTGEPRTGVTVEWLEGEAARFFWNYEADLLTANAASDAPDQQRLNNWWQTTGALVRE